MQILLRRGSVQGNEYSSNLPVFVRDTVTVDPSLLSTKTIRMCQNEE